MAQPEHDEKPASTNPSDAVVHVGESPLPVASPRPKRDLDSFRKSLRPVMLYVVSTAQFLDIVNGASVSVALLPIADDLKFSVSLMPWILNAYTITFSGLLLFSGRIGDLYGHRRTFMFGLFWFATWALVVSFSRSPIMFVVARAFQGIGAASTVPSAMALIATNYPAGPERTKAFSIFSAFGGLGAVVGILMAGGLIASIGWSWIFKVSAIGGYILLIIGYIAIPIVPKDEGAEKPKVDYLGSITTILGVIGMVYYITMGTEDGWASAKTLPILFVGILLLVAFLYIESKVSHPIMPFRIWKSRLFTSSVIIAFFSMGMMQGIIFYINLIFQEVYGWSPIKTAVGFLVHALLAIVVFSILGRTLHKLRLKPLIMSGFLLRCAAALMFAFVDEHTSYWSLPFPGLIIHVFGIGFSFLPVQITAIRDAENKDQGLVGAIYNTGLQLGGPFGIAILNAISVSTNGSTGHGGSVRGGPQLMKGYKNALFGIVAFGLMAFVISALILPWDKPIRPGKASAPENKDLENPDTTTMGEAVDGKEEVMEKEKIEQEIELTKIESLALDAELAGIPPILQRDEHHHQQVSIEAGGDDESTIGSRGENRG